MPDSQPTDRPRTGDVPAIVLGLRPGTTIGEGRYRVIEKLGEGGMGSVFAAEDLRLHRRVAIKVLHQQNAEARARLMTEVELLASLHDPRVVAVTDIGEVDSALFMVTEFLQGVTLEEFVENWIAEYHGPVPPPLALRIGSAIASALSAVHSVGYIHRDLKPANLMLKVSKGSIDWLKLIDFGLSARSGINASREGTPDYVAPETVENNGGGAGGVTGVGTDLYSLGCVLFELLSGRRPFTGTPEDIVTAHCKAPRPRVESGLEEVDDFVERLMARRLADRPESAKWVATELLRLEAKLSREGTVIERAPMSAPSTSAASTSPLWPGKPANSSTLLAHDLEALSGKSKRRVALAVGIAVLALVLLLVWRFVDSPSPTSEPANPPTVAVAEPASPPVPVEPVEPVTAEATPPTPPEDDLAPLSPVKPAAVAKATKPAKTRVVVTEPTCDASPEWKRSMAHELSQLETFVAQHSETKAAWSKFEPQLQRYREATSPSECAQVNRARREALQALGIPDE